MHRKGKDRIDRSIQSGSAVFSLIMESPIPTSTFVTETPISSSVSSTKRKSTSLKKMFKIKSTKKVEGEKASAYLRSSSAPVASINNSRPSSTSIPMEEEDDDDLTTSTTVVVAKAVYEGEEQQQSEAKSMIPPSTQEGASPSSFSHGVLKSIPITGKMIDEMEVSKSHRGR